MRNYKNRHNKIIICQYKNIFITAIVYGPVINFGDCKLALKLKRDSDIHPPCCFPTLFQYPPPPPPLYSYRRHPPFFVYSVSRALDIQNTASKRLLTS